LRAAAAYHKATHPAFEGLPPTEGRPDWARLVAQKDELVQRLRTGKYEDVIAAYGDRIQLVRGWARLTTPQTVLVDDRQELRTGRIVIATGARPRILPIEGIEQVDVLTSTTAMELREQPESLLVLGGRFIALEQAQLFARLGTKVTILQRSDRLIPDHEPEISAGIERALADEGIEVHAGATPVTIRDHHGVKVVSARMNNGIQQEFSAQHVLMAVGRQANTDRLGLDDLGVALDEFGAIVVDDALRSSVPGIYAAGDVSNRPQLVYVAAAAGGVAADNALNGDGRILDLSVLPEVIFTDPQIATVGLTEAQARAEGHDVRTAVLPLEHVPRALAARNTRGLIKLVADGKTDRLLGAHVLAAEGGEIIQTAALAIQAGRKYGFTVRDLREMLFPYLVQAEGLKLAALAFDKDVSRLSCCAG
jgi:mercuric reductase